MERAFHDIRTLRYERSSERTGTSTSNSVSDCIICPTEKRHFLSAYSMFLNYFSLRGLLRLPIFLSLSFCLLSYRFFSIFLPSILFFHSYFASDTILYPIPETSCRDPEVPANTPLRANAIGGLGW